MAVTFLKPISRCISNSIRNVTATIGGEVYVKTDNFHYGNSVLLAHSCHLLYYKNYTVIMIA